MDLGIDLSQSYMVGDKWSDVELGQRAGCRSILVRTGYGADEPGSVRPPQIKEPDHVADGLEEAVTWILDRDKADDEA